MFLVDVLVIGGLAAGGYYVWTRPSVQQAVRIWRGRK
jgi:hypothetical protein